MCVGHMGGGRTQGHQAAETSSSRGAQVGLMKNNMGIPSGPPPLPPNLQGDAPLRTHTPPAELTAAARMSCNHH